MGHTWPVELLHHILCMYLIKMAMHIMIFLLYCLVKTLKCVEFAFVHQEVTKVICQNIVVSMLTMYILPVPLQQSIMLLLKPNLVK